MTDHRPEWVEVFKHAGKRTTVYLYEETKSGQFDLVQVNEKGMAITTSLTPETITALVTALQRV